MTGFGMKRVSGLIGWCISIVFALGTMHGQSVSAWPMSGGPILTPYNTPAANAPVRVCLSSSFGTPCSTTGVQLYSDANLTQKINNPAATNAQGIYAAYLKSSDYTLPQLFTIQIQVTSTITYTFPLLIPASAAGVVYPSPTLNAIPRVNNLGPPGSLVNSAASDNGTTFSIGENLGVTGGYTQSGTAANTFLGTTGFAGVTNSGAYTQSGTATNTFSGIVAAGGTVTAGGAQDYLLINASPLGTEHTGVRVVAPTTTGNLVARGIQSYLNYNDTNAGTAYDSQVTLAGTSMDHSVGYQAYTLINLSGNVTDAYNFYSVGSHTGTGSCGSATAGQLCAGFFHSHWTSGGAGTDPGMPQIYAFYAASDPSYFGGNVGIGTLPAQNTGASLTVNQSINTNAYYAQGGVQILSSNSTRTGLGIGVMPSATGGPNDGFGYNVLHALTSGTGNVSAGDDSFLSLTTGAQNTGLGQSACGGTTTSSLNTCLGFQSGVTSTPANQNVTGAQNTWVGANSGPGTATQLTNSFSIGYGAQPTASNQGVLGNGSVSDVYAGGTSAAATIHASNLSLTVPSCTAGTYAKGDGTGCGTAALSVARGTATMPTSAIAAGAYSTAATISTTAGNISLVTTADNVGCSANALPSATNAPLRVFCVATAGGITIEYYNGTAGSITPTAETINWGVTR